MNVLLDRIIYLHYCLSGENITTFPHFQFSTCYLLWFMAIFGEVLNVLCSYFRKHFCNLQYCDYFFATVLKASDSKAMYSNKWILIAGTATNYFTFEALVIFYRLLPNGNWIFHSRFQGSCILSFVCINVQYDIFKSTFQNFNMNY